MIENIARDVSNKLNATPSRDFDDMVGLDAHLKRIQYLLQSDHGGSMMVGIFGPAGIGKTTIARALQSLISYKFQLTCFMENLGENYHSHEDDYGMQKSLQEQLLSKVLNQDGTSIENLDVLQQRLSDLKVLIILDDVNDVRQLEALADKTTWFGRGSRIVVTTENKDILQQHGINNTYHVKFPSEEEALEILCRYAFRQRSPPSGFKELAKSLTKLCGNLPLGLRVVVSSLRRKDEDEWKFVLDRLETIIDRNIEDVLRVGYDSLPENDQMLFLNIAVFFNYKDGDLVKAMLADGNLDVKNWLKILVNKSLIEINANGRIVMHRLLQQVGRQAISRQEPWKRHILIDANEICHVLQNDTDTHFISGISFDTSRINEVRIHEKAFEKMCNLRFLNIYKRRYDGNDILYIPKEMEFPPNLRLLRWEAYPSKSLPPKFHPEYLVEFDMRFSEVEYLWQGTQPLTNLKKMVMTYSVHLKKLPDLSKATNLETLELVHCESLEELPSSFSYLQKLKELWMSNCVKLQVIPTNLNLASLESLDMGKCLRLPNFPSISTNISQISISHTLVQEVHASIALWSHLHNLMISGNGKLKTLTQLPPGLVRLDMKHSDIENIPDRCFEGLEVLRELDLTGCKKLTSLPKLPLSLTFLFAKDCESLETLFYPLGNRDTQLDFTSCFKLDQQARKEIIQQRARLNGSTCLPGNEIPEDFHHQAIGNTLTFPLPAFSSFKICLVISPNQNPRERLDNHLLCRRIRKGFSYPIHEIEVRAIYTFQKKHLCIFHSDSLHENVCEVNREMVFKFNSKFQDFDIVKCGVQILVYENDVRKNGGSDDEDGGETSCKQEEDDDDNINDGISESESSKISDEEEGEESYKYECGEASKEKDEGIADIDYKFVFRKRSRKTTTMTMTSATTNLKWRIIILSLVTSNIFLFMWFFM